MKNINKLLIGVSATLGILASGALPVSAATTTTLVVPGIMQGWAFVQEAPLLSTSVGAMVAGPGAGVGSANLKVGATGGMTLAKAGYGGVRLDSLNSLEYNTYRTSGPAAAAISLQLNIDSDLTDADVSFQGRLVFEPYHSQTVTTGQWQTWNTLSGVGTGSWWGTRAPLNATGKCPQSNPCTWNEVLAKFPNIGIRNVFGGVVLKVGSGGGPMEINVDKLVINDDIYDFGPVLALDLGSSFDYSLLAGAAITTGASNSFTNSLGAGAAITTGAGNVIPGSLNAGAAITTGADNVIGVDLNAGAAITIGASNTISGSQNFGVVTPISGYSVAMAAFDVAMADSLSRPSTLLAAELGETTLGAGVYSAPAFFTLTGALTLDAKNDPTAVFIIRSPGYISTAAGASIVLANGAQASNVFWVSGSYFSAGAGAVLSGNILATSYVTLGADAGLTGRIFSQSGYITLGANVTVKN
ncbi:ice-binding family protein [Candidatus Aquiluna sp. UB-MaderosW2red]|uniref:ice-binding family protein n=1 Tax=Candidatus Aquiluna sp. UB-MaderosW2red TaxID=1855377 RepID=UPI000875EB74|nr:ice-binding family protein [Candidatus Aquiluna sp. UB-MaderosW2red]SCX05391.1 Protein of unknown function [Candidatus Aquiluna sp. UB-MaderosW2red]